MKKAALIIMALTIISKIIGFGREITLSYYYGASNVSDAYLIALTIPAVIFSFVGVAITTSYIPMYSSISKQRTEEEAKKFTSNIINTILILCTLIVLIVLSFTTTIVKIFASGFEGETLEIAVNFTRITIFGIYFTALIGVFKGYLHVKNSFVIPALIGIPLNLFLVLSIVLSNTLGYIMLPLGKLAAAFSQILFMLPCVIKNGYIYKFRLSYDENLKKMLFLTLPIIAGVSVNQINILVDRTIASQIVEGGISALNYANRLNLFIQGIFVMSLVTVMYPMISKFAAQNNINGLKKSVAETIGGINLLVIPITVGAMIFSEPVIVLLYGRGAFDLDAIAMTSYALFFYSIGMIGFGLREVLARVFYSLQDTKTPMINAAIGMFINIILNIVLSRYLGIGGLALATSIAAIITTILMFISLRAKIGPFALKQLSISFIKILIASLIMGIMVLGIYNYFSVIVNGNLALLYSIFAGAFIYFIAIYFMKIKEMNIIVSAIKRRLRRE